MSDFGDAFDCAYRAVRHVRFLSDLDYRWHRRFRLWERAPDDQLMEAKIDAFAERYDRARRSADEAESACNRLWDYYSRMLPRLPGAPRSHVDGLPRVLSFADE